MLELYDAEIKYVDSEVGRLFENLKESGIYDDTTIILTSDHGEEFGAHGKFLHNNLYEELIHIPLIIKLAAFLRGKQ